jgi:hypothetical protein
MAKNLNKEKNSQCEVGKRFKNWWETKKGDQPSYAQGEKTEN